jgi:uncharacterized protein with PIN domain
MNLRFAAERTLGKLARWLRLLGFDTAFENEISGGPWLKCLKPGTILLTRTERVRKALPASQKFIFIQSNDTVQQLRQIIEELGIGLQEARPFSRCLNCNVTIESIAKEKIQGKVPDYIWENNTEFQSCPKCNNIYWPGSHTKRSLDRIQELFK